MPPAPARNKRERLVDAAAKLVHRQGFHRTTLAELAEDAHVPLGNVYYYFKTKTALGEALLDRYLAEYEALRTAWDEDPDPVMRLESFIEMTVRRKEVLARSGCPIGSLSSELHKDGGPLADCAARLFAEMLDWAAAQFRLLGQPRAEAHASAVHLLSAIEGASLLTHSFGDPKYITQESRRLREWIRSLTT